MARLEVDAFHLVERYRLVDYETAKQAAERHQKEDGPAGLGGNVGDRSRLQGQRAAGHFHH